LKIKILAFLNTLHLFEKFNFCILYNFREVMKVNNNLRKIFFLEKSQIFLNFLEFIFFDSKFRVKPYDLSNLFGNQWAARRII